MNLLIYFCIPLVVTGRTARGTYGQESLIGDAEIQEDYDRSPVSILETDGSRNPETSETSESYSNFYPGHIDYSNPELKNYVADHQDGTYYRKGLQEHRALDAAVALRGSRIRGGGLAEAAPVTAGINQDSSHPSFIPSNIYNSLRVRNRNVPLRSSLRGVPVSAGLEEEIQEQPVADPGLSFGLPSAGLGLGLYGTGLGGLDPRYAALLQGHAGGVQKLASPYSQHLQHSPAAGLLGHQQYSPEFVGSAGLLYQQSRHSPYLQAHSHLAPSPLAYPGGLVSEDEQLPVAQHVVPTIQAPLVKTAAGGIPLKLKAALHAYPHQLLLKAPAATGLPVPLVPLYHHPQPSLLKEVVEPSNTPLLLQYPPQQQVIAAPPVAPQLLLPLHYAQHLYHPQLLQAPLLKSAPVLFKTGPIPVPIQLKSLPEAALLEQPALKATVGPGLPVPLIKPAPGVEASIVPAIEEHVPEEVLSGHVPVVAKAPAYPATLAAPISPYLSPEAVYLTAPKLTHSHKVLFKKPPVLTEKAVLKAVFANSGVIHPHHHHHHHAPAKAVVKAPLLAHYVHEDGHHIDPSLSSKILSSQKDLVHALISSDNAGKLYKKGAIIKGTHLELLPSLSYGYSLAMYPDAKGVYGPPKLLDHHPHYHHHKNDQHPHDDDHHHHHPQDDDHHHHHSEEDDHHHHHHHH